MANGDDDDRGGLIFRGWWPPWERRLARSVVFFLGTLLILVVGDIARTPVEPSPGAYAAIASVQRVDALKPFRLICLFSQALPSFAPPSADDPRQLEAAFERAQRMRAGLPPASPTTGGAGRAQSATALCPQEPVRLQHWGARSLTWYSIPIAVADVVWSLTSEGPFSMRLLSLGQFVLGAGASLWLWALGRDLIARWTGRPAILRFPTDGSSRFLVWGLIFPLATILLASLLAVAVDKILVWSISAFGAAGPKTSAWFAEFSVYGLFSSYWLSYLEIRAHGLMHWATEQL